MRERERQRRSKKKNRFSPISSHLSQKKKKKLNDSTTQQQKNALLPARPLARPRRLRLGSARPLVVGPVAARGLIGSRGGGGRERRLRCGRRGRVRRRRLRRRRGGELKTESLVSLFFFVDLQKKKLFFNLFNFAHHVTPPFPPSHSSTNPPSSLSFSLSKKHTNALKKTHTNALKHTHTQNATQPRPRPRQEAADSEGEAPLPRPQRRRAARRAVPPLPRRRRAAERCCLPREGRCSSSTTRPRISRSRGLWEWCVVVCFLEREVLGGRRVVVAHFSLPTKK